MGHGILEPWKIESLDQARAVVAEALRVIKWQFQPLFSPEEIDNIEKLLIDSCPDCKVRLEPCKDTPALVQQVVELPEKPITRPRQSVSWFPFPSLACTCTTLTGYGLAQ